jgi:membrane protein YqaA with SNARE-associated domain
MEFYFKVFYEAAWSNSIIPFASEATYMALKLFGGYNLPGVCLLAVIGATLGQMFNWYVGKLLFRLHKNSSLHLSEYWYNKISYLFNKYALFILLFTWAPLCKLFPILAGFLNARMGFVLSLVMLGQIYYYASQLF